MALEREFILILNLLIGIQLIHLFHLELSLCIAEKISTFIMNILTCLAVHKNYTRKTLIGRLVMPPFVEDTNESRTEYVDKKKPEGWLEFRTEVIWKNVVMGVILNSILLYHLFTFPYRKHKGLLLYAFLTHQFYGLGVTGGVHRLWTHRSYKAKPILRIILAILYSGAGQNKIEEWVRDHRVHHKFTDTDADPHNINRGFFFSHWGWLMMRKMPEVIERGRMIDISDVTSDPVVQHFDKYHVLWKIMVAFILPVFVPVYFFNQDLGPVIITQWVMRYVLLLHSTFSVNSFAHFFGYRSYDKTIYPSENLWVSAVAGGEGFHNYHHVFPWDCKTSEFPHLLLNTTNVWLQVWEKIGWAYDLKKATPEMVKRVVLRTGDGSHPFYGQNNKDAGESQYFDQSY